MVNGRGGASLKVVITGLYFFYKSPKIRFDLIVKKDRDPPISIYFFKKTKIAIQILHYKIVYDFYRNINENAYKAES